jgi:2'-5' RNA ligase
VKVALALLCDDVIQDAVSRLAFDCHFRSGVALDVRKVPPHISLKQPFEIGESLQELDAAVSYLQTFAARIEPSEVRFGECSIWPGILHFPIVESYWLRNAHKALNSSLNWAPNFGQADFDGHEYRFHLTVFSDRNAISETELSLDIARHCRLEPFTPSKAAVFVYHQQSPGSEWCYLHIKTLRLGLCAR